MIGMENGLLSVVNNCIRKRIEAESEKSVERKKNVVVQCRSITSSSVFFLVITWSSLFCLFHLVQGSSATSLVENLHHSSTSPDGSRWEELDGRRYTSDRYERERDDLEPDDDEIPPPLPSILLLPHRDFEAPRKEAHHFKRYPSLSRRMLYSSSRRERRQPHKYSVSDFDDEYIPKRSRYMVREDEEEDDQRSRQRFSRHSHEDEEPETLPRTYRRSPSVSDFHVQDIEGPSFKAARSVRPQTGMRSSYNMYDDAFSPSDMMGDHHQRSATNFRRQHDFERPPPENGKEGFGYSRSYYKKYVPDDDYESNLRTPSNDFQVNKRQSVMFEEPHESFTSFLQGMYGSSPYSQPKPAPSSRTGKSMSAPPSSWPGLTMDSIPILDPKPVLDKSFMENFLASNNKHFHSDSKDYESESSSDSNQAYDDDNDSENEESQHHSHRLSKPHSQSSSGSSATASSRLRSFKSFMPFGFGNIFGGSPSSESSQNSRNRLSDEASRVSNIDDAIDEEEDSSSHHDSCDSHDSSDSKRHVKFASPEIEIVPSTIKSTSVPSLDSPTLNSTELSSLLGDQTSTKSPPLSSSSSFNFKNKNISDVSSSNPM